MHAARLGRIVIVKYLVEETAAQVDNTDTVSYSVQDYFILILTT